MQLNSSNLLNRCNITLLNTNKIFRHAYYSLIFHLTLQCFFFSYGRCIEQNKNYIINGNFSNPIVSSRTQYFPSQIEGWKCTWLCQIKNCIKAREYWLQLHKIDSNCIGQVIDLNSNRFNEIVSQQLNLDAGIFNLHFNYYYPNLNSNLKWIQVNFNNKIIYMFQPQVAGSFNITSVDLQIIANDGINILQFANYGYSDDGHGFKMNNVSLERKIDYFIEEFINLFLERCKFTNSVPGARVVFRSVLSFLINFDRFQLYIYHNRIYSYNAKLLILSVNQFLSTKSDIATTILSKMDNNTLSHQQTFIKYTNYKQNYIKYSSFDSNYQHANYFDNLNQSFVYLLPFIISIIVLLNILFKMLFQKPISLLFRKFQLRAIILIMIFDGNIESLTFYTLAEFKIFFSDCFLHKWLNVFVLAFFFLMIFTVFALLFWVKFYYGKKAKYLLDQQDSKMSILWGIIIDRGIICMLFGAIHQLLIYFPNIQLLVLAILEILWIIKKMVYICKKLYRQRLLVSASIMGGVCRLFFQLSCFLYQQELKKQYEINQYLHSFLIYAVIVVAFIEILIGLFYCLQYFCKIFTMNRSKISNINKRQLDQKKEKQNIFQIPKIQNTVRQDQIFYLYCRRGKPFKFYKLQDMNGLQNKKGKCK